MRIFRQAMPDDAENLAIVHVTSWQEAYRGIVPTSYLEGFTVERRIERFREILSTNSGETWLGVVDGKITGFISFGPCRDPDVTPGIFGEIWGLYLAPQFWRQGMGQFLVKEAIRLLAQNGYSEASLWVLRDNLAARKFYETQGFSLDGATKEVNLGAPLKSVRYRMKLRE